MHGLTTAARRLVVSVRVVVGVLVLFALWLLQRRAVDHEIETVRQDVQRRLASSDAQIAAVKARADAAASRLENLAPDVEALRRRVSDLAQHLADEISRLEHTAGQDAQKRQAVHDASTRRYAELNSTVATLLESLSRLEAKMPQQQQQRSSASIHEIASDLSDLTFAFGRLLQAPEVRSALSAAARQDAARLVRRVRDCDFNCSVHGLSVNIPGVTNGCVCECVSGFSGPLCQQAPPTWRLYASTATPPLVIPHHREEVPPMNESAPGCKAAAKAYYLERYKSEEFRTDRALKFFWTLARGAFTPQCSSKSGQVIVVDIGANVGEQLPDWEREVLNLTSCSDDDSLLILVEPNPANLAVLRHRVDRLNRDAAAAEASPPPPSSTTTKKKTADGDEDAAEPRDDAAAGAVVKPKRSGRVVVVDGAASYYDGVASFAVNRLQDRSALGNERGSLDVRSAINGDDGSGTVLIEARVERLPTILRRLAPEYVRPNDNFTISLLKIDAEGYDPAVLYGAFDVLPRTNVIVFECHKLWRSAGFAFRDVAEYLAKAGFKTFKMGIFYWIPVTPPAYWDDVYDETLQWSNCVAVRNGHPFEHMFMLPPPCANHGA